MFKSIPLLIALVPSALGAIIVGSSSTSILKCSTKQASTSVKSVPSSTQTRTVTLLPVLLTSWSTPIATSTPKPVTSTSTVTSVQTVTTTASTITDIFSTTSTATTTVVILTTTTTTLTASESTTTTSTVNSAVPTSAGFLPVQSTVNRPTAKKRSLDRPHSPLENRAAKSGKNCAAPHYPAAVSCVNIVEVRSKVTVVLTAKTSTTRLPPSTITAKTTTVLTSTSTVVPPDVSTTLSFSTTVPVTLVSIVSATTATTSTTTLTATTTLTEYDACATNNLLGPNYNGNIIDNVYFASSNSDYFTTAAAASAYDCCVSCITSGTCSGSAFETGSGSCYQLVAYTCPASPQPFAGQFVYEPAGQNPLSLVVSNSYCGYLTDGGVSY